MTEQTPKVIDDLLPRDGYAAVKCAEAWPGLSIESQIQLLQASKESPEVSTYYHEVVSLALGSSNAYVRYLAAKEISWRESSESDSDSVESKISHDSSALVRAARFEQSFPWSRSWKDEEKEHDLNRLFGMSREERFAAISGESTYNLVDLLGWLLEGVSREVEPLSISELDLFETLELILKRKDMLEFAHSGWAADPELSFDKGKKIARIWDCIPRLPDFAAQVVLRHIPVSGSTFFYGPERHHLENLTPIRLHCLLDRSDVAWIDGRKKYFDESDELRGVACRHNFRINYEDLDGLLSPEGKTADRLTALAFAGEMKPVLYLEVARRLEVAQGKYVSHDSCAWAKRLADKELSRHAGWQLQEFVRDIRIWAYAIRAQETMEYLQENYPLDPRTESPLAFLDQFIETDRPWETFVRMQSAWASSKGFGGEWRKKFESAERHLDSPEVVRPYLLASKRKDRESAYDDEDESRRVLVAEICAALGKGPHDFLAMEKVVDRGIAEWTASRDQLRASAESQFSKIKEYWDSLSGLAVGLVVGVAATWILGRAAMFAWSMLRRVLEGQ